MNRKATLSVAIMILAIAAVALHANSNFAIGGSQAACGSGRYIAALTGWDLNGAMPKGEAAYSSNENRLYVEVENVKLKDGLELDVLIGDDRIGKLPPLKEGTTKASITLKEKLDEKSRVRVFDDDRPIVSANLRCDASQAKVN